MQKVYCVIESTAIGYDAKSIVFTDHEQAKKHFQNVVLDYARRLYGNLLQDVLSYEEIVEFINKESNCLFVNGDVCNFTYPAGGPRGFIKLVESELN